MSTTTWTVTGMTCGHCVKAVTEEISTIVGVTDVVVDHPGDAADLALDLLEPGEDGVLVGAVAVVHE